MYRWTIQKLTRLALGRLRAGDARLLLALAADDVHFRFLGRHSWAADFRSKAQMREWLGRYRRAGLELQPHEALSAVLRGTR